LLNVVRGARVVGATMIVGADVNPSVILGVATAGKKISTHRRTENRRLVNGKNSHRQLESRKPAARAHQRELT
jgi:hypothetical protein